MKEHGSICLIKEVLGDLNGEIWTNAKQVGVISGMMNFAKRQPVGYYRVAIWLSIRNNVRSVKKFRMV